MHVGIEVARDVRFEHTCQRVKNVKAFIILIIGHKGEMICTTPLESSFLLLMMSAMARAFSLKEPTFPNVCLFYFTKISFCCGIIAS